MKKPNSYHYNNLIALNVLVILVQLGIVALNFNSYPEMIPLFLSRPWGNDQLAPLYMIFLLPLLCACFLIIGVILKKWILKDDILLTYLCLSSSLLFSIFGFISIFKITQIII